ALYSTLATDDPNQRKSMRYIGSSIGYCGMFLLGYYPLAKPRFDRIRPAVLRCVCKLLLCNAAVLAMYGLLLVLIPAGSISQELRTTAWIVTLSTLAMGNVAFLLYDRALHNLLMLYRLVWQPKLHRMLGMH
ncbi:MAG: hypothetical protein V8R95_00620, partial [Faecalibacterium sp.]